MTTRRRKELTLAPEDGARDGRPFRAKELMTTNGFRKLVLSFPNTEERAHHGHPDFRAAGRIFATLHGAGTNTGMVQLTPEQQSEFMHDHPQVFSPAAGKWGQNGSTIVNLPKATKAVLTTAVEAAWKNAITKSAKKSTRAKRSAVE
jgi:hypothetical protein